MSEPHNHAGHDHPTGAEAESAFNKAKGVIGRFFEETNKSNWMGRKGLTYIGLPLVVVGGAWAMSNSRSKEDPKAEVESQLQGQATGRAA